jgi:hypothetical protein
MNLDDDPEVILNQFEEIKKILNNNCNPKRLFTYTYLH